MKTSVWHIEEIGVWVAFVLRRWVKAALVMRQSKWSKTQGWGNRREPICSITVSAMFTIWVMVQSSFCWYQFDILAWLTAFWVRYCTGLYLPDPCLFPISFNFFISVFSSSHMQQYNFREEWNGNLGLSMPNRNPVISFLVSSYKYSYLTLRLAFAVWPGFLPKHDIAFAFTVMV